MPRRVIDCTLWLRGDGEADQAEFLRFETGDSRGDTARLSALSLPAGQGTYMVGQAYADIEGLPHSDFEVQTFFGEGLVAKFNFATAGTALSAKHLQSGVGQAIKGGDILLLANLGDPADGPSLTAEAARWIINQSVKMVGFDRSFVIERKGTLTNHRLLLGAGIPVIHNLINLSRTSGRRVAIMALPLALYGAASAPCRVVVID